MKTFRNSFENIADYELVSEIEQVNVSDEMFRLLYKTFTHKKKELNPYLVFSIEELSRKIISVDHYILDENNFFVGKKFVNKGKVVRTSAKNLLRFVALENEKFEEMGFICMPCVENPPYIFANDDD